MRPDSKEAYRLAFSARFREALAELGYSPNQQARLQALFGVSGQAVRKWAEGTSIPDPSRMPAIAAVLGVRRAWLQDGETPMRPHMGVRDEPGAEPMPLDGNEVGLLLAYRALGERERTTVTALVSMLAETARRRGG